MIRRMCSNCGWLTTERLVRHDACGGGLFGLVDGEASVPFQPTSTEVHSSPYQNLCFVGGPLAGETHVPDPRDQCLAVGVPGHPRSRYVRTESRSGIATMTWHTEASDICPVKVERDRLCAENECLRKALTEIQEIAAREWAADVTNYEWYGDIAGSAEAALGSKPEREACALEAEVERLQRLIGEAYAKRGPNSTQALRSLFGQAKRATTTARS